MRRGNYLPRLVLYLHSLADLDAVAVDVEHEFERVRVGRIEEADHIDVVLEVGVQRVVVGARSDCVSPRLKTPLTSSSSAGP
jgi:hypothetical protein